MIASSQPLANNAGYAILSLGGNAADAAVAVAAALAVVEPCSTGIGGDCFALYWDEKAKKVKGLNGSGRSPAGLLPSLARDWAPTSPLTVTVPGAVAGWHDAVTQFGSGRVTMRQILDPAIRLAREGFPVQPTVATYWSNSEKLLQSAPNGHELLLNGSAPREGQLMTNANLARVLELVAEGKDAFYAGEVAEAIVAVLQGLGGVMALDDLRAHRSLLVEPISTNYRGVDVYEIPPNGQGLQALMALNLLEGFDLTKYRWGSGQHLHILIECMRLAFSDGRHFICCPETKSFPADLLSKSYADSRRNLINEKTSNRDIRHGHPDDDSGTVYFSVVDNDGNACSFINSNYMGFGTGIVPKGCGFPLQNRGYGFNLEPTHRNCVGPNKRPFHTIIPGMMVKRDQLLGPFGVMGGFMQPQGHMQVVSNLIDWKMNPQVALDAPRFCIKDGTTNGIVAFEDGFDTNVLEELSQRGHLCESSFNQKFASNRGLFGNGQIILRSNPCEARPVWCGGSDPRHDGHAFGL